MPAPIIAILYDCVRVIRQTKIMDIKILSKDFIFVFLEIL